MEKVEYIHKSATRFGKDHYFKEYVTANCRGEDANGNDANGNDANGNYEREHSLSNYSHDNDNNNNNGNDYGYVNMTPIITAGCYESNASSANTANNYSNHNHYNHDDNGDNSPIITYGQTEKPVPYHRDVPLCSRDHLRSIMSAADDAGDNAGDAGGDDGDRDRDRGKGVLGGVQDKREIIGRMLSEKTTSKSKCTNKSTNKSTSKSASNLFNAGYNTSTKVANDNASSITSDTTHTGGKRKNENSRMRRNGGISLTPAAQKLLDEASNREGFGQKNWKGRSYDNGTRLIGGLPRPNSVWNCGSVNNSFKDGLRECYSVDHNKRRKDESVSSPKRR
jgi:hypothetical protein